MITQLYGFKKNQTREFIENGNQIPVTYIDVSPNVITRIIDSTTHKSYQLGIGTKKSLAKAQAEELKKAGVAENPRFFREVRVEKLEEELIVGKGITVTDVFQVGDAVSVTGTSRGKGFAGVVKRHGFAGMPKTHGTSDRWRAPGSIGSGTTPGRVFRGKRMAGRMGSEIKTVQGLEIIAIDAEKNIVTVKGLIPGSKNGLVKITKE